MNEFDRLSAKKNEAKEKKKKIILTGIVICVVLIFVLAFMILYYRKVDNNTFKLFIDDVQVSNGEGFYIVENNQTYVRARDIASYIKWSYQNGEYGEYTEDQNSGYIQNDYEAASFVSGSNILKKYIIAGAESEEGEKQNTEPQLDENGQPIITYVPNSETGTLETTKLEFPIISKNGQIYFPLSCLADICNCRVNYENPFRMYIYDQEYLINKAGVNAAQYGFQSLSGIYENMRALAYGMMVVSDGQNYGVVNLDNGSDIIGLKYSDMIFAQNSKEFFVKTNNNDEESVGIISVNGSTVVPPKNYSNIQILSDELGLYLVEKDEQYGVLDKDGEVVVHCEYDSVGIPEDVLTEFEFSAGSNKYVLFDDTIIVDAGGKYGIYDTDGTQTLATAFAGLGFVVDDDTKSEVKNAEKAFTIELDDLELSDGTTRDVKAIVLQQEIDGGIKYGLYDSVSKKLILQCYFDRIYGVTSRGNTEYYYEFQGETGKLSELLSQSPEYFEN